jgi:hypothetical protein
MITQFEIQKLNLNLRFIAQMFEVFIDSKLRLLPVCFNLQQIQDNSRTWLNINDHNDHEILF